MFKLSHYYYSLKSDNFDYCVGMTLSMYSSSKPAIYDAHGSPILVLYSKL